MAAVYQAKLPRTLVCSQRKERERQWSYIIELYLLLDPHRACLAPGRSHSQEDPMLPNCRTVGLDLGPPQLIELRSALRARLVLFVFLVRFPIFVGRSPVFFALESIGKV